MSKGSEMKIERSGGLAFIMSLFALSLLAPVLFFTLLISIRWAPIISTVALSAGAICGWAIAKWAVTGRGLTLLHEVKHMIVSGLAGNKARQLIVNKDGSGEFEYGYYKSTAHYNAFISLAPYFLPLFTPILALAAWPFLHDNPPVYIGLVALALGVDLETSARDVSPIQSDLHSVRGGYRVAVYYVMVANGVLASLIALLTLHGFPGLLVIVRVLWDLGLGIVNSF